MFGLTTLGIIHTAISLIAVFAALVALVRDRRITMKNQLGKIYIASTFLTCITALGIYQHGGFGPPHALAIITMVVLASAMLAEARRLFGRASPYIATVGYSATFLFHMIPALTETTTRLPFGDPIFPTPDAPGLQKATLALLVLFVVGAILQVVSLRKAAVKSA